MGFAVIDREKCFQWAGTLLCRSCYERCPVKWVAMKLERGEYPVITEKCAGCGLCEHVCPAHAITITPTRFVEEGDEKKDDGGKG